MSKYDFVYGEVRSWMQWQFLNGDEVTWGSMDVLKGSINVSDVESLARSIVKRLREEDKSDEA